jgi:hypothetical protein
MKAVAFAVILGLTRCVNIVFYILVISAVLTGLS